MPFQLDMAAALGLKVRPATEEDLPFLSALYRTTRADELAATGWPETSKALFVVQQFSAQHGDYLQRFPQMERLIVEAGGTPIGRVYIDSEGETCHLVDISLMPDCRGQGRGQALLQDLMAHAARAGKALTLSVLAANPAAKLYARMGFRIIERGNARHRMRWKPPRP